MVGFYGGLGDNMSSSFGVNERKSYYIQKKRII